ncbi:MAG: hypothetical protein QOK40_2483 [Miltoncostaeaceae bacterium]|nr:hypothetical protein [Miltoncostaeaceae bacterium]
MKLRRLLLPLASALVACLTLGATAALADVRGFAGEDPQDQAPALSGPARPDVQQVRVGYDPAGTLTVTARFYAPIPATSIYNLSITVGEPAHCSSFGTGLDASFFTEGATTDRYPIFHLSGFTGLINPQRAVSADGLELTMSVTNPALANRDFTCGDAHTSFPDDVGHCGGTDCSYWSHTYVLDDVAVFSTPAAPAVLPAVTRPPVSTPASLVGTPVTTGVATPVTTMPSPLPAAPGRAVPTAAAGDTHALAQLYRNASAAARVIKVHRTQAAYASASRSLGLIASSARGILSGGPTVAARTPCLRAIVADQAEGVSLVARGFAGLARALTLVQARAANRLTARGLAAIGSAERALPTCRVAMGLSRQGTAA